MFFFNSLSCLSEKDVLILSWDGAALPPRVGDGQDSSGVEGDKSVPFIPAKTFSGAKKGYVFKNGEQGLGYYTDRHAIAERKQGNGGK